MNYHYSYCAILLGLLIILHEKKSCYSLGWFLQLSSSNCYIVHVESTMLREKKKKKKKRRLPVASLANKMHNIGSTCKHALGALMDLRAPTTDAVTVVSARAFVGSERDGNTRHSWIPWGEIAWQNLHILPYNIKFIYDALIYIYIQLAGRGSHCTVFILRPSEGLCLRPLRNGPWLRKVMQLGAGRLTDMTPVHCFYIMQHPPYIAPKRALVLRER